jgi:N-acetyltransferase
MLTLENERVLLRLLTLDDYDYLLPFALNEARIWQYSLISPAGSEGLRAYIAQAVAATAAGTDKAFIVFDKATQEYAGCTRFYSINEAHKAASLGYTWYGTAFQRTGLNRHCKLLLFTYAFEEWGLARVELRADTENAPSIAAMQAVGCTVEGVLRSDRVFEPSGKRASSIVLSMLRDEWCEGKKAALQQKIYAP